ncbi:diguanylate cyclase [Rhizobium helianthi]|uniref:diguanylate cyclase n=1 Tax=Rhizobium helianthi TaxID=1132695 RepID=A0ABW4M2N5_9HYPH
MMLDYRTLLISLGVSTLCLLLTILGTWMARRQDGFLLTCVVGLAFLVPGIFTYSYYTETPSPWIAVACCSLMLMGFATIYAAARQFRTGASSIGAGLQASLWAAALTALPIALGLDGLGFVSLNLAAASMLFATALEYWRAREEARGPLTGMAALYAMTGTSFVLCAAVLALGHHWVLGKAPDNWAEDLNIAVSIAGMTGIGAMSLMVHQARLTEHHRRESLTDALTGLSNRRALFEAYEKQSFSVETAVIVFDIDRFKLINDQHGHAVGDEVIRAFAEELNRCAGLTMAARLGGEEFAAVLRNAAPGYAEWLSERIRRNFADREIHVDGEVIRATVSAGVAYGREDCADFDGILRKADAALYLAKRNGRNRVELATSGSCTAARSTA